MIVTHSHPDHFGGAGRLRDTYGAEVISHRSFRTWFDPARGRSAPATSPGRRRRSPTTVAAPWGRQMPWRADATFQPPLSRRLKFGLYRHVLKRFMRTPAPTRRVDDAEIITLARREWVALHTPGHTNDHLCLFDAANGIVLSGDHVLPTITPAHLRASSPAPIRSPSSSPRSTRSPASRASPSRSRPTGTPSTTSAAGPTRSATTTPSASTPSAPPPHELGDATVEEYSHKLFKPRSWGQMAESETYAHLEHLRETGEVTSRDDHGTLHYAPVE